MKRKWIAVIVFWAVLALLMAAGPRLEKMLDHAIAMLWYGVLLATSLVVAIRWLRNLHDPEKRGDASWAGRGWPAWFWRFAVDDDRNRAPLSPK